MKTLYAESCGAPHTPHLNPHHPSACRRAARTGAAALLLLAPATNCLAATDVSGIVAGQTWTSAGSPYRLVGDVFVVGLTVESNVVVQAAGNYEFEVAGQIKVRGTSNAPVLFTAEAPAVGWRGILFRDAVPGSYFTYTTIEYATKSALRITNTPPALTNCVIQNNTSPSHGGGILALPSGSPLILKDCVVSNNYAGPTVTGGSMYGGGICVLGGSVVFTDCLIVSNRLRGAISYGAGLFVSGNCTMLRTHVLDNKPTGQNEHNGDGIYFDTGVLDMANCIVRGNGTVGAGGYGGGVLVGSGTVRLRNSVIATNAHDGTRLMAGSLSLVNCTVVGNTWHGVTRIGGVAAATNCIFYFNHLENPELYGISSVAYCDVQGTNMPGPGNISFNPALCPGNLALIEGSPCIDGGSPEPFYDDKCISPEPCSPFSRGTIRNDMGVFGGPGACDWIPGDAPEIVTPPRSQASCLGQTVTLSVGARGAAPLAYQWYFQNAPMLGETAAQLVLANLQSSQAGAYYVTVANAFGSVTSAPVQLVVNDACVDICMYAGLNISGLPDRVYELRYTTDLSNTNFSTWPFLATNTTPWFYLDTNSCGSPRRFYGVKLLP